MIFVILAIAAWIVCGVFAYGFTLAYFQLEFPGAKSKGSDTAFAALFGALGPIGLIVALSNHGSKYGLLWKAEDADPDYYDKLYRDRFAASL